VTIRRELEEATAISVRQEYMDAPGMERLRGRTIAEIVRSVKL